MGTLNYLTDSNVVIDFLAGRIPAAGMELLAGIMDEGMVVSVITRIEVLGCDLDKNDEKVLRGFLDEVLIIDIGEEIADQTIQIRKTRKIKVPDAIIAATAIVLGLTLLTRNVDDFKGIKGLKVINPWRL
jgi:predicted nucleic acid-binding protein